MTEPTCRICGKPMKLLDEQQQRYYCFKDDQVWLGKEQRWKEREPQTEERIEFPAEYMGGHPMHPTKKYVHLVLDREQLVVQELGFSIPYKDVKRVENMTREKISAGRVLLLGIVGALWKKEKTYMVITTDDPVAKQEQSLIFDVENLEEAQPALYQRVVAARS